MPNKSEISREDVRKFIHENYIGTEAQDLTDKLNKRLNTALTREQVKGFKARHRLDSGLTGRFSKGHVPTNKGKKMEDYLSSEQIKKVKRTCFKKSHVPKNHLPVGSEILYSDGYTWVKIAEPKSWKAKHRLLYENYHGKKTVLGKVVIFLDGNTNNFSIDNLALVSKNENKILNRNHLRYKDKELTKTGIAISRLKANIYKKEKENS